MSYIVLKALLVYIVSIDTLVVVAVVVLRLELLLGCNKVEVNMLS